MIFFCYSDMGGFSGVYGNIADVTATGRGDKGILKSLYAWDEYALLTRVRYLETCRLGGGGDNVRGK